MRAEGKYFTGGVDVNVFKGLSESDGTQLTADLLAITHRMEELPFPTLASVQRPLPHRPASSCRWPAT